MVVYRSFFWQLFYLLVAGGSVAALFIQVFSFELNTVPSATLTVPIATHVNAVFQFMLNFLCKACYTDNKCFTDVNIEVCSNKKKQLWL